MSGMVSAELETFIKVRKVKDVLVGLIVTAACLCLRFQSMT
jgi:hypothetical protein